MNRKRKKNGIPATHNRAVMASDPATSTSVSDSLESVIPPP